MGQVLTRDDEGNDQNGHETSLRIIHDELWRVSSCWVKQGQRPVRKLRNEVQLSCSMNYGGWG